MNPPSAQALFSTLSFANLNTPSESLTSFKEGISDHHFASISITLKDNASRIVKGVAEPVLFDLSGERFQSRHVCTVRFIAHKYSSTPVQRTRRSS